MSELTVVLTSCRRGDLLEKTLDSFFAINDFPVAEFIVIEDSDDYALQSLSSRYPDQPLRVIVNGANIGQHASIDRAYAQVKTPYILHLEDDWIFPKPGFVKQGLEILKAEPQINVVQLRTERDLPASAKARAPLSLAGTSTQYHIVPVNADRTWHSFTFNPSLKRLSDYQALEGGYSAFATEAEVSIHYKNAERPMAWLLGTGIDHIGWGRSNFATNAPSGLSGIVFRLRRLFSVKTLAKWQRSLKRRLAHRQRRISG